MSDDSSSGSATTVSGGVNVAADQVTINGDVAGRDIIKITGYTVDQVSTLLTQISSTFQPKPFDGRCPYLGLANYDEETADLFFGRERLAAELVTRVRETRWVFITGPSGSGKSSLVRAGLMYGLKHSAVPDSEHWLYESLKPGRDPLNELARVASSLAGTLNAGEDIRTKGQTDPTILHQWAEVALKDKRDRRAVILVDQFEETFTQVAREAERAAFLNLLSYAATVEGGRVMLVFAMRSDFVSNCAAYPQLNDLLNQQFIQIGVMTPAELVSAIAQPALRVGLQVEPELVTQIIADMRGEPGALPLVQFALKDLFDAQQASGGVKALTLKDYLDRGGIHKALERHADSSFAQLSDPEQAITHEIFGGLIQVGRGAEDTRRTALFDELVPAGVTPAQAKAVVGKLADARLIITDERDGRDIVTIAHEKLIDAWPWLRKLVNENRDAIALQNQIAEDAAEWWKHQRDASYLYTGARLANAREQLAAKKIKPNGLAQAFVMAGVEAEETQRMREAARLQKELDAARKLAEAEKQRAEEQTRAAESAEARARVERRATLRTRLLLGITVFVALILAAQPAYRFLLRQQASIRMVPFNGSRVTLGYDAKQGAGSEPTLFLPHQPYTVAAFALEPYEVTNQRYLWCVEAGACSLPIASPANYQAPDRAQWPVVSVTAQQAYQFCDWLGRRLPGEIEWERAARNGDEGRWPWGVSNPTSILQANFIYTDTMPPLAAVGYSANGVTPEGIFDLAGNAWEWTSSDYNLRSGDWADLHQEPPDFLSVRGGGANNLPEAIDNIAYRLASSPFQPDYFTGFRCAASR